PGALGAVEDLAGNRRPGGGGASRGPAGAEDRDRRQRLSQRLAAGLGDPQGGVVARAGGHQVGALEGVEKIDELVDGEAGQRPVLAALGSALGDLGDLLATETAAAAGDD